MTRFRHLALAAAFLGSFALARSAEAQARQVDLVELLRPTFSSRLHPLADPDGRVPVIVALSPDEAGPDLLPIARGLYSLRLTPDELSALAAERPQRPILAFPKKRTLLDRASKLVRAGSFRQKTGLDGRGVVVGIVDTGIDARHEDFRNADGTTRIAWMLDMSMSPLGELGHAELEAKYGCTSPQQLPCRVLDAAMIDASLQGGSLDLPRDPVGHGTHVASIAAGNGGEEGVFVGVAPAASLVIARVTPAGGNEIADTDVVTAARFIFDRAEAMGMPAVVNVSLGGDFGPHDGTSPLEKGLAELVGREHPGRAIVVAAGNSGALYEDAAGRIYGVHTEARVVPSATTRIRLRLPGLRGSTLTGQAYVWITFRPGDDVSIGLEGPGGDRWIDQVSRGTSVGETRADLNAAIVHGVVDELTPLTEDTFGAIVAFDGKVPAGESVTLTLEGRGTPKLWVQGGGDLAPGAFGAGVLFEGASKEGTINVPATHPELIAVGCTLNRVSWTDASGRDRQIASFGGRLRPREDGSCYFSSSGPTATGVFKPDISAPGAFVAAAMSDDARPGSPMGLFDAPPGFCDEQGACLQVSDHHALLSGTSMSAPMVAGAIALLLQRDPSLTQGELLAVLQAGARRPTGDVPYDFQLGAGALDVEGMVASYEHRAPSSVAPDPARSWMALSDSYARPDPSFPVVGQVEIRDGDGEVVDGFDPARLTLTVEGGLVRTPLQRVAPGLYRFEVAAPKGSGQSSMRIEVRFDGQIVGEGHPTLSGSRTLPIGVDRWVANGEIEARGGCSVAPSRRAAGWELALLGLAFTLAWRRRPARR